MACTWSILTALGFESGFGARLWESPLFKIITERLPMDLEVVADGLQFPEGPVAMADGSVLVVEIRRQSLTRVNPDGRRDVIAHLGGGPNGAAIGPDGQVYICNNGGFGWATLPSGAVIPHGTSKDYVSGSIQRVHLTTGAVETVYTKCQDRALKGPNDIVFDRSGGFWFTDFGKGGEDSHQYGALHYALPDGSAITRQRDRLLFPNGVGLSLDETILYVSDTWTARLWAFEIESPGVLKPQVDPFLTGRLVGTMPGYTPFDSLAIEADGKICVATCIKGGITIFDRDDTTTHVAVPDPITTNLCFGGPDMSDVWITGSSTGRLFKTRWPRPGKRLAFGA